MKGGIAFFIVLFLAGYAALQWYIGWHGLLFFQALLPELVSDSSTAYWSFFWLLALSFLIGRAFLQIGGGGIISRGLLRIGAYWLAAMQFLVVLLPIADVIALGLMLSGMDVNVLWLGSAVIAVLALLFIRGIRNATSPVVRRYEVTVAKETDTPNVDSFRVVLASDLHLGWLVGTKRLRQLVETINAEKPDVVVLTGDIIDDDMRPFLKHRMGDQLRGISSRWGVYAVTGNHDPLFGEIGDRFSEELSRAGITLLRDESEHVGDVFWLVGRQDRSLKRFGMKRRPLVELLEEVETTKPVLLMDHQPYGLEKAEAAGVDVMLSGHTHRGQLAPNHWLTRRMFELDWGVVSRNGFHAVVTSGFGTWGPPVRLGSRCELVELTVRLEK